MFGFISSLSLHLYIYPFNCDKSVPVLCLHGDPKSAILGGLATSLRNFSHSFNMLVFTITLGLMLTSMSPKVLLENLYDTLPRAA